MAGLLLEAVTLALAFEVFDVLALALTPPGLFTAGLPVWVFCGVPDVVCGVVSITTVFDPEDVLDPVAPPERFKVDPPVVVDEPPEPPTLITVPPAVFVATDPFPIKLAAEFVFEFPAPVKAVKAVFPLPPVVAAPVPPP